MKKGNKLINLGLQGGGAHGAFTWGALDYLLEDGRLNIEGISATSAGSINAAVLAHGLLHGDKDQGRQALYDFWFAISNSSVQIGFHNLYFCGEDYSLLNSPAYLWFSLVSRIYSPYQFNPLNINPLRDTLEKMVDFEALRKHSKIKLFICTTNVETCKMRIFGSQELSADAVLASACLPFMFQAVEIEGNYYWDGGYIGNPAIYPLIYSCNSPDVLIIHINPIVRPGVPKTANEILNRINEISFNSSLMREMRAIAFVTALIEEHKTKGINLKKMHMHSIRSDEEMAHLDVSSKMNIDWQFICHLRDSGRNAAKKWLHAHFNKIGHKSSIDIGEEYL